jgi:CPA2 family monovalent cation:H+ antiporter-2
MHELPLLINLTVTLAAAFVGGFLARLVKFPPMVGYLVAGVAIGPFTPGYASDLKTIQQFAELGIIFLMFGVGLHFSLQDLWTVRAIAIPGALLQMGVLTLLVYLLAPLWGWSSTAGILLGIAVSIASTVVMLRNLMDQGLLHTQHGQVAVGWLVLEDLITVLIMVLLPTLVVSNTEPLWQTAGLALLKAGAFAALMLVAGTRLIPWLLTLLAHAQSRELFVVAIVIITVGTALSASLFFGVSLALGAFLAGVVVSESSLSHQVGAEIVPFRELFTVLFFVSVGMLVNPLHLWNAAEAVLALTAIIVLGKFVVTTVLGIFLISSARTTLALAVGRSQIGEFSFILGGLSVSLGLLTQEQYSLLLAGAMLSIMVNPFLFRALPWIESTAKKMPMLWSLLEKRRWMPETPPTSLHDHVVIVGYGRVGQHIVQVLGYLGIPRLVVDLNLYRVQELERQGIPTLYGDAANSEILSHAQVSNSRTVVITVPDEAAAKIIVATVRSLAKRVPVVVRAATHAGVHDLFALEANDVIHPELEGGLNIVRQTLILLGYQEIDAQEYTDAVHRDHYNLAVSTIAEQEALSQLRASTHLVHTSSENELCPPQREQLSQD